MDETPRAADDSPPGAVSAESSGPPTDAGPSPAEALQDAGEGAPIVAAFPVVGVGASAGGLAAFEAFFSAMPAEAEIPMAFVLVQHLSPDYKSILHDLLRRYSSMPVHEVQDGMEVRPGCIYVIPPNCDLAILNGALQLLKPTAPRGQRLPIDFFFRSLAQDQKERAIGVVLSGTGSDGSVGVRAIKAQGGMVLAQAPDSTEYDGMPRSAIATGLVDYVLSPVDMPAQIVAYVSHAFPRRSRAAVLPPSRLADTLKKICVVLRAQTRHDFSQYKQSTIGRRVERRMALHQIEYPEQYLRHLQRTPREVDALFRDLLIGVTSFFRDPEAFAVLQNEVIPRLFAEKPPGGTLRVWVCGCSTGEEAYSVAILLQEHLETLHQSFRVQVFATDVDASAIEQARAGVFSASSVSDLSPERVARFFSRDDEGGLYRINKGVRDLLVFSEQDVIRDPPFSKVDLICCRNLLIYMEGDLQKKLIPLFHYALNPGGMLFLGTSETVGEFITLFELIDRKSRIYQRREDDLVAPRRPAMANLVPPLVRSDNRARRLPEGAAGEPRLTWRDITEQTLREHRTPTCILVNGRGDILHAYGRTGKFLEVAEGDTDVNILSMAREGLQRELLMALHRAGTHGEPVCTSGLRVRTNGDFTTVDLAVRPAVSSPGSTALADLFLVILEECAPAPEASVAVEGGAPPSDAERRISALEAQLRAKEEYLEATIEEMQTSNEELKSTNEELQSVNEELQSTNEELETSKEELQSVNEELATVNAELQDKLAGLFRVQNDLNNLLAGTGVGTLFVDHQVRIARFTPNVTPVINLITSDIGRPLGHIVSNLVGYDSLVADVQGVLDTLVPRELEVQTREGVWFLQRIRPYRTLDNVIEGAVITYVDISDRKAESMQRSQDETGSRLELASLYDVVPVGVALLGADLRFVHVNERLARMHGVPAEAHQGRAVSDVVTDPDAPLRRVVADVLRADTAGGPRQVAGEVTDPSGTRRPWLATWCSLASPPHPQARFSVVVEEKEPPSTKQEPDPGALDPRALDPGAPEAG